jgi:threonine/homoserine/homoserine lactone efflux protein
METRGELLTKVLPLAIGAAISPVVLTLQVLTLAKNRFPLRRTWAIAAGCSLVACGWAAVALLATNKTGAAHSGTPSATSGVLALAFALLLVGLGVHSLTNRTDPGAPKPEGQGDDQRPRGLEFFVIGLGVMVTNFTSFLLFFPAVHAIGISDADETARVTALAVLMAITLIPAYVPPLVVTVLGARAQAGLDRLGRFVTSHHAAINATICFVFAAYLAARGIDILT